MADVSETDRRLLQGLLEWCEKTGSFVYAHDVLKRIIGDKPTPSTDPARSLGGHLFENMQRARKELRHRAHVYARTKDRTRRDEMGDELEKAAIAMALSAALHGLFADCARPAGKAGVDWYKALNPEDALEMDRLAQKTQKRKRR